VEQGDADGETDANHDQDEEEDHSNYEDEDEEEDEDDDDLEGDSGSASEPEQDQENPADTQEPVVGGDGPTLDSGSAALESGAVGGAGPPLDSSASQEAGAVGGVAPPGVLDKVPTTTDGVGQVTRASATVGDAEVANEDRPSRPRTRSVASKQTANTAARGADGSRSASASKQSARSAHRSMSQSTIVDAMRRAQAQGGAKPGATGNQANSVETQTDSPEPNSNS
jgi:hypothetical protein